MKIKNSFTIARALFGALFISLFLITTTVFAAPNSITTPDPAGLGSETSLVLDSNQYPVIAYYDEVNDDLRIMHCNDVECSGDDESITTPDSTGDVGRFPSIALDSTGYPVVSYWDVTNNDLKVMHCNDANCAGGDESIVSPDTVGNVGSSTSLALDASGYPVVSYVVHNAVGVKLLHCNDANCAGGDDSIETFDTVNTFFQFRTSLALDGNGYPVISYFDGPNGDLKVAHCNDANCAGGDESITSPHASSSTNVGVMSSLKLDGSGNPVISYTGFGPRQVFVMHCNDANCAGDDESVQSRFIGFVGNTALALDVNGFPVVAIHGNTNTTPNLYVLRCNDANCDPAVNGQEAETQLSSRGLNPSIALDNSNRPIIVFRGGAANNILHVLRCADQTCNENAPTDMAISNTVLAENAASGTIVGTLSTTDSNAGDTFTYALITGPGDTDNASFAISGADLEAAASFDFETKTTYSVRIRSTDSGGLFFDKVFTINVSDVNEAPTDILISGTDIVENQTAGTSVGNFSTIDVDTGDTFTYALVAGTGDTDNASFTIDGDVLDSAEIFNFETKNSYSIRVRTTDSGGLTHEEVFTINVTDVSADLDFVSNRFISCKDNLLTNSTVGLVDSVHETMANAPGVPDIGGGVCDQLSGQTLVITLTNATDPADISIVGTLQQRLDYYNQSNQLIGSYTHAGGYTPTIAGQTATVLILQDGTTDYTPTDTLPVNIEVNYALLSGRPCKQNLTIYSVSAAAVESVVEAIPNTPQANFGSCTPAAGQHLTVTLVTTHDPANVYIRGGIPTRLDYFDASENRIGHFSSADGYTPLGAGAVKKLILQDGITDIGFNEAPTDIALSSSSIDENEAVGTTVGTLSTTDANAGDTFTYALVAGENDFDNGSFAIVGDALNTAAMFDFETKDSYTIRVRTTDAGGLTYEEVLTIAVNDVAGEEQPPTLAASGSVNYSAGNAAVVVAPNLTVTGPTGATLDKASVTIGGGFAAAEDVLGISGQAGTSGTVNGIAWTFDASKGAVTFSGTAPLADYQAALRLVTYANGSGTPSVTDRVITFNVGDSRFFEATGHYYEYIPAPNMLWTEAIVDAESRKFYGLQGYLATITSAEEDAFVADKLQGDGWIGATDDPNYTPEPDNGPDKKWYWASGPEKDTHFFTQNADGSNCGEGAAATQPTDGGTPYFTNWHAGGNEPNDYNTGCPGSEDYGHYFFSNPDPSANRKWNDYPNDPINDLGPISAIDGYIIEYGGMPGDPVLNLNGQVTVTISTNDAPVATDDIGVTLMGQALTVNAPGVLSNDTDADNDPLTAAVGTQPGFGTVTVSSSGSYTYTPIAGFNGLDTFTYIVSDGTITDTGSVTVYVLIDPTVPVEVGLYQGWNLFGYPLQGTQSITTALSSIDGKYTTVFEYDNPNNSWKLYNPTLPPAFSFLNTLHELRWAGGYWINATEATTITFTSGSRGVAQEVPSVASFGTPPAVYYGNLPEGATSVVATVGGAVCADGTVENGVYGVLVSAECAQTATNVEIIADGQVIYVDEWTNSGLVNTNIVPTAITLNQSGTNHAQSTATAIFGTLIVLAGLTLMLRRRVGIVVAMTAVFMVAGYNVVSAQTPPDMPHTLYGNVTIDGSPAADGTTITVHVTHSPTETVTADTTVSGGIYTIMLDADDNDTSPYDGGEAGDAITIEIDGVRVTSSGSTFAFGEVENLDIVGELNIAPVAGDDTAVTAEGVPITVDVLANDSDVNAGDTIALDTVGAASNGIAAANGSSIDYTPAANFNGTDVFTYTVSDGDLTDTGTVTVTVVSDATVVTSGAAATLMLTDTSGTEVALNIAAGDVTTDTLITIDEDPAPSNPPVPLVNGGTAFTIAAYQGGVEQTPFAFENLVEIVIDYNGLDLNGGIESTLVLSIYNSGTGLWESTGITITQRDLVNNQIRATVPGSGSYALFIDPNTPPVAQDDSGLTVAGVPFSDFAPGVLANDSDVDGQALSAAVETQPVNGSVSMTADGGYVYTPNANFTGMDSFTYRVSDGIESVVATVTIRVLPDTTGDVTIPLYYSGWNMFGWPVATRAITDGLQSIDGHYTTVYGYDGTDSSNPWRLYDVNLPPAFAALLNNLDALEFGEGYWIRMNQPMSITVSRYAGRGVPETLSLGRETIPSSVPATYYGVVSAETGSTLSAWVDGSLCGTATVADGGLYGIHVRAATAAHPDCGRDGSQVTFTVDGVTMGSAEFNQQVAQLRLNTPTAVSLTNVQTTASPTAWLSILLLIGITAFVTRRETR